jgi:hypothetical protein
MSRITAPVGEVTTPMTRGRNGSGRLRSVEQPLGGEPRALLEQRQQRALAGQLQPLDDDLVFRAAGIGGELAGGDHLEPVLGRNARRRGAAPHHPVDHRAFVLQRSSRRWPEAARLTPDSSPRSARSRSGPRPCA